jgi:hypothetical protein
MSLLADLAILILLLLPLVWTYLSAHRQPGKRKAMNVSTDDERNQSKRFLLFAHLVILALLAINVLLAWLAPKIMTFAMSGWS